MAASPLDGVRAIFFDAVGTLLHPATPVTQTYRAIALRHRAALDEQVIRARLVESFQRQELLDSRAGWRTDEAREADRWRQIVGETLLEAANPDVCFSELWEWYRQPLAWRVEQDTEMVLTELGRRGMVVGMASNFDARLAAIVGNMPSLAPLVGRVAISSILGWRKPAREFFDEVIQLAGCSAQEILFIGDDSRNDYHGARQAGLRALLFDPLAKSDITSRIKSLSELL